MPCQERGTGRESHTRRHHHKSDTPLDLTTNSYDFKSQGTKSEPHEVMLICIVVVGVHRREIQSLCSSFFDKIYATYSLCFLE
jgi:hypothetical protein